MRCALVRLLLLATVAACVQGVSGARTSTQGQEETATYTNKRFGFMLSYPTAHFKPKEPLSEDGRLWISHDGHASLLAGALPNADGMNLTDYRELVLKESYAGRRSTTRPRATAGSSFRARATAPCSTSA